MLPKQLHYGSKVESAASRSYRSNIAPQSGTGPYNAGDTIIINIPTRANLALVPAESYLKFNLNITSGAAANSFRLDSCGSHGIISRLRVFSGSNLLEDIDQYGLLAKILYDMQVATDSTYGKQTFAGTRSDLVVNVAATATNVSVNQVNSGCLHANAPVVGAGATVSDTYCINLVSLMGSLCSSQYFPLWAATSAPIRLELILAPALINACAVLVAAPVSTFTITNCEYVADFIELGDSAMQTIYSSLGGEPLQFCVPQWRNYQYNAQLANGVATQINMPIPAKFSSLKSLITTTRPNGAGASGFFPFSSNTQGINSFYWRVGPQVLPSKSPDNLPEMFMEAQKAMGSLSDLQYQPSIEKTSYTQSVPVAYTVESATTTSATTSGSFYAAIDLENFAGSSKDTIFAGVNTNTDDVYFVPTYTSPVLVASCRFDAFAAFDGVLVFENGTSYIKF